MARRPAKDKGVRHERELAELLWEKGWAVVRGPASGAGVKRRFQPDLIAAKSNVIAVFEVKRVSDPSKPLYIEKSQVEGILEWARRAGGRAFIAVRIPGEGWRFHSVESLELTPRGRFKVASPTSGLRLSQLLEILARTSAPLDKFLVGKARSGGTSPPTRTSQQASSPS